MTYDSALTAIIARLTAAGFVECTSPFGLTQAGAPRQHQAFAVVWDGDTPQKGRSASRTDGQRVQALYTIQLGHEIRPSDGLSAAAQARTDTLSAKRHLAAPGTVLTTEGAVEFKGVRTQRLSGGAYHLTAFQLGVTFNLDLTPP